MSNLYIVTVATHTDYYFPYLVQSCKRFGYDLVVLGYGQKWLGYNWKFKLMINFLKNLNDYDIVCFIDGYDVICNRNLNELKNEFIKFKNNNINKKIIIAHNKYTPKTVLVGEFSRLTMNNYDDALINSGSYIGYALDLYNILNEIYTLNSDDSDDDQYLLTEYYKNHKDIIYIDLDADYFIVLHKYLLNIDYLFEIKNKDGINVAFYNNKQPFFIHGPGYTNLNMLIQKLGYNLSENDGNIILNRMSYYYLKKVFYYYKHLIKKYMTIFIFIIIILFLYIKFNNKFKEL